MTDSWSARKLEPGFAQAYSMSSDRSTSTMKSDPQWSVVSTSTSGGGVLSARALCSGAVVRGGATDAAIPGEGTAPRLAATAAPFRKLRRVGENLRDLPIFISIFLWFSRLIV